MKNILKSIIYLQMATLLFASAVAGPVKEKLFQGPVRSFETQEFVGTTMFVDGSGAGHAMHLGRFTYTFEFDVNLLTGEGVGSAEFVAANGDSFSTTITATAVVNDPPGFNHVTELHTIVGGTGRFAGASGEFILDRLVPLTTSTSNAPAESIGTVEGVIATFKGK